MEENDRMSGVDKFFEALDKMVGKWLHGQQWFRDFVRVISGVEIEAPVVPRSDIMVDYSYDLPPAGEPYQSVFDDPDAIQHVTIPALGTLEELTGRRRR